jgi:non-homologous end joining protein Ku
LQCGADTQALVSYPVSLFSVRYERGSIRFNLINPASRYRSQTIPRTPKPSSPLSRSNLVRGYEFKNATYVLLSDEGLDKVDEGLDKVRVTFMLLCVSRLTKWIVMPVAGCDRQRERTSP